MPIYEFRCSACRHVYTNFFRSRDVTTSPPCPECGGEGQRKVSAAFHVRGEAQLLGNLDQERLLGAAGGSGGLPSTREFANWARTMHETVGDTLGQDFRGLAEKAEAGENPVERLGVEHTLRYNIARRQTELSGGADAGASSTDAAPPSPDS